MTIGLRREEPTRLEAFDLGTKDIMGLRTMAHRFYKYQEQTMKLGESHLTAHERLN